MPQGYIKIAKSDSRQFTDTMAYTDSTFSNPITKAGRVVYNVCLDLDHAKYRKQTARGKMVGVPNCVQSVSDHDLTVQPHELCLEQDSKIFRRGLSRSVNDTEILLLSSLNGLKTNSDKLVANDAEATRQKIRASLKFGGVASTRSVYQDGIRIANDAIFVSQYGGLCTIMNTGDEPIRAGQWVLWDLPKREGEGTKMCGQRTKQMVITRPYGDEVQGKKAFLQQLTRTNSPLLKLVTDASNNVNDTSRLAAILNEIQIHSVENRSRIIGRAMTNAATGETFDLLLGRYCC